MSSTGEKRNLKKRLSDCCEACGYKEHTIILTLHHIYPKREGLQPKIPRPLRYLVLCPNCHDLVELGIIDDKKLLIKMRGEYKARLMTKVKDYIIPPEKLRKTTPAIIKQKFTQGIDCAK